MKLRFKVLMALLAAFIVLQFVRPDIPERSAASEIHAPAEVQNILRRDCYSCHSDEKRLSWFDEIQPGYWLVRRDILTAREHLNFSRIGSKPEAAQRAALYESVNMIQLGAMPLPRFLALHPEAKVTVEELSTLKTYLVPWAIDQELASSYAMQPATAASAGSPGGAPPPISLSEVRPEFNGLFLDTAFEGWQLISTTDRGDNNTFRFILGNELAMRAIQSGNIKPWPDGAEIAKIAWTKTGGPGGIIQPGMFVQVELMVKNERRFKSTEGWGWGRWRGLDLKPYGENAGFVEECTTCHLPVKGNDSVYTLPITSNRVMPEDVVNTNAAALPASLPYQPLRWKPVTMYVVPTSRTMAILFATKVPSRGGSLGSAEGRYAPGTVLALVTWTQRDDPHWFGARIPDVPQSVEFVTVKGSKGEQDYKCYGGPSFQEERTPASDARKRESFILNLSPAQLP